MPPTTNNHKRPRDVADQGGPAKETKLDEAYGAGEDLGDADITDERRLPFHVFDNDEEKAKWKRNVALFFQSVRDMRISGVIYYNVHPNYPKDPSRHPLYVPMSRWTTLDDIWHGLFYKFSVYAEARGDRKGNTLGINPVSNPKGLLNIRLPPAMFIWSNCMTFGSFEDERNREKYVNAKQTDQLGPEIRKSVQQGSICNLIYGDYPCAQKMMLKKKITDATMLAEIQNGRLAHPMQESYNNTDLSDFFFSFRYMEFMGVMWFIMKYFLLNNCQISQEFSGEDVHLAGSLDLLRQLHGLPQLFQDILKLPNLMEVLYVFGMVVANNDKWQSKVWPGDLVEKKQKYIPPPPAGATNPNAPPQPEMVPRFHLNPAWYKGRFYGMGWSRRLFAHKSEKSKPSLAILSNQSLLDIYNAPPMRECGQVYDPIHVMIGQEELDPLVQSGYRLAYGTIGVMTIRVTTNFRGNKASHFNVVTNSIIVSEHSLVENSNLKEQVADAAKALAFPLPVESGLAKPSTELVVQVHFKSAPPGAPQMMQQQQQQQMGYAGPIYQGNGVPPQWGQQPGMMMMQPQQMPSQGYPPMGFQPQPRGGGAYIQEIPR